MELHLLRTLICYDPVDNSLGLSFKSYPKIRGQNMYFWVSTQMKMSQDTMLVAEVFIDKNFPKI
jgi:Fe-S cluster biosynthesis and repair protein YggX